MKITIEITPEQEAELRALAEIYRARKPFAFDAMARAVMQIGLDKVAKDTGRYFRAVDQAHGF